MSQQINMRLFITFKKYFSKHHYNVINRLVVLKIIFPSLDAIKKQFFKHQ